MTNNYSKKVIDYWNDSRQMGDILKMEGVQDYWKKNPEVKSRVREEIHCLFRKMSSDGKFELDLGPVILQGQGYDELGYLEQYLH